jgi:hypothetical protein
VQEEGADRAEHDAVVELEDQRRQPGQHAGREGQQTDARIVREEIGAEDRVARDRGRLAPKEEVARLGRAMERVDLARVVAEARGHQGVEGARIEAHEPEAQEGTHGQDRPGDAAQAARLGEGPGDEAERRSPLAPSRAGGVKESMGPDAEIVEMTDPIEIPATIPQASQPGALAAVESGDAPQIVEGQGAQPMSLGRVEQPTELFARRLVTDDRSAGFQRLDCGPHRIGSPPGSVDAPRVQG